MYNIPRQPFALAICSSPLPFSGSMVARMTFSEDVRWARAMASMPALRSWISLVRARYRRSSISSAEMVGRTADGISVSGVCNDICSELEELDRCE